MRLFETGKQNLRYPNVSRYSAHFSSMMQIGLCEKKQSIKNQSVNIFKFSKKVLKMYQFVTYQALLFRFF